MMGFLGSPVGVREVQYLSHRFIDCIETGSSFNSVLGHIFTMSFVSDKILLPIRSVYGGPKINGQSLYYFYPHMSF